MARKFAELESRMTPASRERAEATFRELAAEMPMHELRQAKALSQAAVAERLQISQAAVSKLEHRTDVYVSTLRDYIEAMGGQLEIVARFPEGDVRIANFAEEGEGVGQAVTPA